MPADRRRAGGWGPTLAVLALGGVLGAAAVVMAQQPPWSPIAQGDHRVGSWTAEGRFSRSTDAVLVRVSYAGERLEVAVDPPPGVDDGVVGSPLNVAGTPFLVGTAGERVHEVRVTFAGRGVRRAPAEHVGAESSHRAFALPWDGAVEHVEFVTLEDR
jgi:hypothetical protein